jgi:hypothetical protein
MIHTLAYYVPDLITEVESFIVKVPGMLSGKPLDNEGMKILIQFSKSFYICKLLTWHNKLPLHD